MVVPPAVAEMDRKEKGRIAEGLEVRALGSAPKMKLTFWVPLANLLILCSSSDQWQ